MLLLGGIKKLYGNDHELLEETATKIEQKLKKYEGTLSVSADKINSGYYLNIEIKIS